MSVHEELYLIPLATKGTSVLEHFYRCLRFRIPEDNVPVRFVVSEIGDNGYKCEISIVPRSLISEGDDHLKIFSFRPRNTENCSKFTTVLVIPTGIGAEIGGHAGDATPIAKLLAETSDTLILHPNVVNASDLNEAPHNSLYVEGSVICRLLMGTVGIQPIRSNRVIVVMDGDHVEDFIHASVNSVNAAVSTYGLDCPAIIQLNSPAKLATSWSATERANGVITNLDSLFRILENRRPEFDAIAITSLIQVPAGEHAKYFMSGGKMTNPWGGVEAMLTHALSLKFDVPTAHSPMMESLEIASWDPGVVEPRLAAEAVSMTFLNCVLKGLQKSPRIVSDPSVMANHNVILAEDISCLVIPDGCVGLPTLAAMEQGIPVIAVKQNRGILRNDLHFLPWKPGKFFQVDNYLEAAGVILALKSGLNLASVKRPLPSVLECPDGQISSSHDAFSNALSK